MRQRLVAAFALALVLTHIPLYGAQAAEESWLSTITDSDQVVLVTAVNTQSTTGKLSSYQRIDGQWQQIQPAVSVFLGRSGLTPAKLRVQSSGTTPMGTFGLTTAFGRETNPGTQMPYTHLDHDDAWTYNPRVPRTYNLFQSAKRNWRSYGKYVEHLWALGPQYDYVVTTTFNEPEGPVLQSADGVNRVTASANTKLGGGIFLHVSKGVPTAGCISMNKKVMRALVQWLTPAAHPVVVIGLERNFRM